VVVSHSGSTGDFRYSLFVFVKIAIYPYGKWEMFTVIIIAFPAARDLEVELNILMYTFYIF